eukprot:CAMPEP_0206419776 /NCGR_PEP_ID=MMETSP0324_2-20121206/384_1 /ASSEMBLY_ACC=CAM_ASM_000836 /TAXON_ID=2866 /ORGANISM="Crypthecodinium cohnii, Strain Seligo" /LENGTH=408 /DNA_ID=CAMNT_0053883405 /DNA_START=484 /DNA_END=1706 /DNA_ORIENTATION=-
MAKMVDKKGAEDSNYPLPTQPKVILSHQQPYPGYPVKAKIRLRTASKTSLRGSDIIVGSPITIRPVKTKTAGTGAHPSPKGIEPLEDWSPSASLSSVPNSSSWSRLEKDLYLQSNGVFNPAEVARHRRIIPNQFPTSTGSLGSEQEVYGRVSVVTPTMSSRVQYHEQLWASFEAQTWPDKELIVVETHEVEPSPFLSKKAREDPRLVFLSFKIPENAEDFTVGLKRDMTLYLATGEFVANFDDDDVYSAVYIERMIGELQHRGLEALTFSGWYNFFDRNGVCTYTSQDCWDEDEVEDNLYGFGFSYVHRRRPGLLSPYPNIEFAEDLPFMMNLMKHYGEGAVGLMPDSSGLCIHMVHRSNSTVDPLYTREVPREELVGLEVAKLPIFVEYLEAKDAAACWPTWWDSMP